MYYIDITDNYNSFIAKHFGPYAIKDHVKSKGGNLVIKDLSQISNKSLVQLKEENPNLLIFPEDLSYHQDGFQDKEKTIFSLYPDQSKEYMETGNVMGWIGIGKTQLRIYSRFDSSLYNKQLEGAISNNGKERKLAIKPKKDFFMFYLLSRVGAFHLTAWDYTEGEGLMNNFLMLKFIIFSIPLIRKRLMPFFSFFLNFILFLKFYKIVLVMPNITCGRFIMINAF